MRILHTADWQLGMTRHYLAGEAQARFAEDRLQAVRDLLKLAAARRCEAVVVAGDVFETNQVDRRVVAQALDALASAEMPVFLLPGNHDPLDATSIYRSRAFADRKPDCVQVLDDGTPRQLPSGGEVVGAPWSSKRPLQDLVAATAVALPPANGPRVLVAHGMVDRLVAVDRTDPALISLDAAERTLAEGRFHYLALGDRHSPTRVGDSGRVFYSGAQETTDFDERDAGTVLVVDVDASTCRVERHRVGRWTFWREQRALATEGDLEVLRQRLQGFADKRRTVAKLGLTGTVTLRQRAVLDEVLEQWRELLAAVIDWERMRDLAVVPDDEDFTSMQLGGYAAAAAAALREQATVGGEEGETARDALSLLFRLARRQA